MAVWARVVGPLAGREIGDIERFGDHEAEVWLRAGVIVECEPRLETATAKRPTEKRAATRRTK